MGLGMYSSRNHRRLEQGEMGRRKAKWLAMRMQKNENFQTYNFEWISS